MKSLTYLQCVPVALQSLRKKLANAMHRATGDADHRIAYRKWERLHDEWMLRIALFETMNPLEKEAV